MGSIFHLGIATYRTVSYRTAAPYHISRTVARKWVSERGRRCLAHLANVVGKR